MSDVNDATSRARKQCEKKWRRLAVLTMAMQAVLKCYAYIYMRKSAYEVRLSWKGDGLAAKP
jgi:hypothetical protein